MYAFLVDRDRRKNERNETNDPLGGGVNLDASEPVPRRSNGKTL